jgi:hypothetical protein
MAPVPYGAMDLPTARDLMLFMTLVLVSFNVKIFDSINARNCPSFIAHYEALINVLIEWPYKALSYRFRKVIIYGVFSF